AEPKPEIYLTDSERRWAASERAKWPAGRPVCLLSTEAVTDQANVSRVDWARLACVLKDRYTLIQPVLDVRPLPGVIAYRKLSTRQFMLFFSVVDRFVGGTSGGSHVAAAFDVPTLIVAWRMLLEQLPFPISGAGIPAAFLYPQHWFIAAEEVSQENFDTLRLEQ